MSQLPAVPFGMRISPELEEYLTVFRREIEAELDARPELQGGVLIVTPDKPLQVWKDGVFYSFGEDVIPPMLGASDRASQGGNLAETDGDNTFTGNNTFAKLNAEAVYDDGTLLTDYVFDAALDGQIDIAAYDEATPDRVERCEDTGKELKREVRTHGPARAFCKCMDELDPAAFEAKWRESRKLPAVARCPENPSLGQLAQALLETCEVQAVHIAKLEARLRALEERA